MKRLFTEALDAIKKAVAYTNQTYVDELKKSNTFSAENQKAALEKSIETAKRLMTEEAYTYLNNAHDNFTEWLTAQVESEVREQKLAVVTEIKDEDTFETEVICGENAAE